MANKDDTSKNSDLMNFRHQNRSLSRRKPLKKSAAGIAAGVFAGVNCDRKTKPEVEGMTNGNYYYLARGKKNIHNRWNKDLPPVLNVHSGDIVTLETREASDGHFTADSTMKDIVTRDSSKVHPITGPVYISEAEPGDVLKIDILNFELGDWGWTYIDVGKGLLPEKASQGLMKIWTYDKDKAYAQFTDDIRIKLAPFCGVMGVAWEEPGKFRTIPPRKNGGNMDIRHLTAGSTLYLPVFVKGALFSAGDGHAAQGDGEVSVSAIETDLAVTVKLSVMKKVSIDEPQYEDFDYYATTGFGTSILEAARKATDYMITHLSSTYGITTEEAYILCSVAMDLKISETVCLPHYLVSAHIPKSIFI